jgi:hypothetical protein
MLKKQKSDNSTLAHLAVKIWDPRLLKRHISAPASDMGRSGQPLRTTSPWKHLSEIVDFNHSDSLQKKRIPSGYLT